MEINRTSEKTTIKTQCMGSMVDMSCIIEPRGYDNDTGKFKLKIETGGQVQGGLIEMCGSIERDTLLPFLKQIVYEMELLNNK